MKYEPRNDFVLFRTVEWGETKGGVLLPDISKESRKNVVIAVGPKVEGLKEGDVVLVIGVVGQDVVRLPREKDLLLAKQENVIAVVREE